MTERNASCDPNRLRLLLADEMPPELAAEVTAHIAECLKCQQMLASLAGDEDWWAEVTACLKGKGNSIVGRASSLPLSADS
jgi:hypothetical protein